MGIEVDTKWVKAGPVLTEVGTYSVEAGTVREELGRKRVEAAENELRQTREPQQVQCELR